LKHHTAYKSNSDNSAFSISSAGYKRAIQKSQEPATTSLPSHISSLQAARLTLRDIQLHDHFKIISDHMHSIKLHDFLQKSFQLICIM